MARPADHLVAWHRQAAEAEVPISAYFELTHRCNLRCAFCCNRKDEDEAGLSLDEWRRVIGELRELGTLYVTLTGGEPLAHPEFFEIAAAVRERHMAIRLLTNGTLIDDEAADRIAALHPLSVEMSLHGAKASTHDEATGVAGSFAAVVNALELLRERDVTVALKTPVTRRNLAEVNLISDFAESHGVPVRIDSAITPRDDGNRAPLRYAIDDSEGEVLEALVNRLGRQPVARRTAGGTNCGLGRSTVTIDPCGEIYPCVLWRTSSYGNTRHVSLRTSWNHPCRRGIAAISDRANERALAMGEPWSSRPLCPAIEERLSSDPTVSPPRDPIRPEAAKEARR